MLKPTEQQVTTDGNQDKDVVASGEKGATESAKPEDIATRVFKAGLPQFKKVTSELSKNQLLRVLNALVEAPLNDKKFIFYDQKEVDAFNLGSQMSDAKFVMFQAVYNERLAAQVARERAEQQKKDGYTCPFCKTKYDDPTVEETCRVSCSENEKRKKNEAVDG